jgi:uncharacterized protein with PIN domain
MFPVLLTFRGDLAWFLRREFRQSGSVRRTLGEKTSVKDAIEACGVPHVEVDLIVQSDELGAPVRPLGFSEVIESPCVLEIYSVPAPDEILPDAPRLQRRHSERFVADGHLGTLVRYLRLLGVDVWYENHADDGRLLGVMEAEDRVLLTRDRRLLMHSVVHTGYCPRSDQPEEQAREVVRRFGLGLSSATWSRCLCCNGLLANVSKDEVLAALADEPRTLRHHENFLRCQQCGRIYWRGSHDKNLRQRLARIVCSKKADPC